jgi:hypothetical protein
MVDPDAALSVRRQCEVLGIHRSGVYYAPSATSDEELELMRRIDELHLAPPFLGSRKLSQELRAEGRVVNRKRVQRLMQQMGIVALAPQPQTSTPAPEHVRYPYLLRGLRIDRVNHVWAADITYIPLAHGFVYLVAIMDWYSRRARGGACALSRARDLQHGSGRTVHGRGVYERAAQARHPDQHGRSRAMPGQRLRRTAVALAQVRGGLPARIRRRERGSERDQPLDGLLQ